jgi:hypothetical protein
MLASHAARAIDRRILAELQTDAWLTNVDLANQGAIAVFVLAARLASNDGCRWPWWRLAGVW